MIIKQLLPVFAFVATSVMAQQTSLGTGIDKVNMDLSVKPGTDFYQYATGGWTQKHPLTPEYSRYTQFNALSDKNNLLIRQLVESLASQKHEQGTLEQKIGSYYRLAMDSVRRNREDYAPIKSLLNEIDNLQTVDELQKKVGSLQEKGVPCFFSIVCYADMMDSRNNLVQLYQGGLSMEERDYYLAEDEPTTKIRNAYRDYVKQLFLMTGYEEERAEQAMLAVLKIETRIAKASYTPTQLRNVGANYHKISYEQLLKDYSGIKWDVFLKELGVPAIKELSVSQPEPIHEVENILRECPLEELKAYLIFKVIDDACSSLSDRFVDASFQFYGHTMQGTEQNKPRWKRAIGAVERSLGMAVGRMYVEKYFPESSKQRMLELVKNLQNALGQRIDQQKWMSAETKQKAHEKLNSFYVKIGYPDKWMDYSKLDIDEKLSYYENRVRVAKFTNQYFIEKRVNKPTDRTEWLMTPQTINAYYNPTTNEICFPAGILQPPFFNAEADDACNYGAIGVVIGHEMTHGFDDQGAQYDTNGNFNDWWTKEDKKNFEKRTAVMSNFFDSIKVLPDLNINGKLTLGENIADHGGLNVSFQALQNAMKTHPLKKSEGFTPEQRFFLSYGFVWACNTREAMLRQLVKTDPHSPARWRVNGALPHIDAWYKAFNIKKSDPLYIPKNQRVDIW